MTYTTKAISGAALGKAIKSIAKRGATLDKDTQSCLLQSLIQIDQHDNYDYASKIIKAMGRSQRANAAVTYIQSHAPARSTYKGKTFAGFKKDKGEGAVVINITAAEQVPFWNFTTEKAATTITLASLEKRLVNLVKAASDNLSDAELEVFAADLHRVELKEAA